MKTMSHFNRAHFRRASALFIASLFLVLGGCNSFERQPGPDTSALLENNIFKSNLVSQSTVPPTDILRMNDEMRSWVRQKVAGASTQESRLRRLVSGLLEDGLLNLEYDENETFTARQTFYRRKGNCLSFSILFVALAREAGLDARFQLVDIPPSFTADDELVYLNDHVNVIVRGVRSNLSSMRDHIVDFNTAEYSGNYGLQRVSDSYAYALFYSNLGVELMRRNENSKAFAVLKQSIQLNGTIPGAWVNLGVLYSREGAFEFAMGSYHQALHVKSNYKSALVNLSALNARLGNKAEADRYLALIDRYVKRNPYYFFEKAKSAYQAGNYRTTIDLLNRSIKLRRDDHQFYFLRALSYLALNEINAARKDLVLAERNSAREGFAKKYQRKLGLLDVSLASPVKQ